MKKMVFIACALMLVVAGSAMAGTNLAWNDCVAGGGASARANACANAGSAFLYPTFNPPGAIPNLAASDALIDVEAATSVSNWWLTSPASTRWGSAATEPASGLCLGWWGAAPSGPIVFAPVVTQLTPSRIRVRMSAVIAAGEEQAVATGTEYFAGALQLKFSAGSATNTECAAGAAIGVVNMILSAPGSPDVSMETADVNNCVTFRTPAGKTCPSATPTERATWGSIKALYR